MYKVYVYGEEDSGFIFNTSEDADLYISFIGDGHKKVEAKVFQRKYYHSLNPYVAWFDADGKMLRLGREVDSDEMLEHKFQIKETTSTWLKRPLTFVSFWDACDLDRARVLAQSMYDGWIYAKSQIVLGKDD